MRSFGHLERDVMRVIGRAIEPITGHDIAAQLPTGRAIACTTLITAVDRLRDKGSLVSHHNETELTVDFDHHP